MRDAKARTALLLLQCLCQFGQAAGYTKAIILCVKQRFETTLNFAMAPDLPPGLAPLSSALQG